MTRSINFHELAKLKSAERQKLLERTEADLSAYEAKVRPIIAAVREEGDSALARFAREFDKSPVKATEIAATEEDFARAEKALDRQVKAAMDYAAAQIRKFHEDQKPEEMWLSEMRPGAFAGDRIRAIGDAGTLGSVPGITRTIVADRHILLPGLINAHNHAFQTLYRGLGRDRSLADWSTRTIFPLSRGLGRAEVRAGALLACLEPRGRGP